MIRNVGINLLAVSSVYESLTLSLFTLVTYFSIFVGLGLLSSVELSDWNFETGDVWFRFSITCRSFVYFCLVRLKILL